MVKNSIFISLLVIIFGCNATKNDYGMARFTPKKFSIQPQKNTEFTKYVDTTAFYVAVHAEEFTKKYQLENFKSGLKFYGNGKVGLFKGIDFDKASTFDPKKAMMGYYEYKDTGFFVEYVYEIPGGSYRVSKNEVLLNASSRDTLVIKTFQSATSAEKITKYVKKALPSEALQYQPDW